MTVRQPAPIRSSTELDDLTLTRARMGDRAACGALVRFYERPVFALLSRMLAGKRHTGLREDLAQDTFLRALRALPSFDPSGPARLSTWLLTIAARLAISELERKTLPLAAADLVDEVHSPSELDPAQRREIAAAIERAVADLPPAFRAAFLLREVHDMSYEEIATALNIDVGTVRSRLSRARSRLQAALRHHQEEQR